MENAPKPRSRFYWIFIICIVLLVGGALLGLFVLPDMFKSRQAAIPSLPTQTTVPDTPDDPAEVPTETPSESMAPTMEPTPVPTPAPTPIDPSFSMSDTVAFAKQSVVTVLAQYGKSQELHSGFIYGDGFIVTAYAGFEKAGSYSVLFNGESTPVAAKVIQFDAASNLLVLTTSRTDLVPVTWAQSASVKAGDYVFAVGTPLDIRYQNLVTRGTVGGVNMKAEDDGMSYIVTDAATNPGQQGGVLFNNRGEMIGMLTDVRMDAGYDKKGDPIQALGMTFAAPTDSIYNAVITLIKGQSVQRASLDLTAVDLTARQKTAMTLICGVRVTAVKTGGAAQLAGIQNGDILTAYNSVAITDVAMLDSLIGTAHVGDTVALTRVRNGLSEQVNVTVTNGVQ